MNKNTTYTHTPERDERCSHYIGRGFMLWGPVYTAGVSGVVYMLAPSASSYTEILLDSLIVCPPFGAAGGYLRWRFTGKESGAAGDAKASKGRSALHRLKPGRKAMHDKAA